MKGQDNPLTDSLNNPDAGIRLESLKRLMRRTGNGELEKPVKGNDVNNHIHTFYSFSPYSPSKAVWMAYQAGLATAGIIDHDSISGAEEFIEAGKTAGIATTIGVECRADFSDTPLCGRRINNPDQNSIAYVTLHGIPHTQIGRVKQFFLPFARRRNERNRKMVEKLNNLLASSSIKLDFDQDVVPLSKSGEGGSITERHILYALSLKLISVYGKGPELIRFLKNELNLKISSKTEGYLSDPENPYYAYDLLGLLKSELVSSFYIDASEECPPVSDIIDFSNSIGAISAYAYLGDVGDSVTGDKKAQKFEDEYIDLLFAVLKKCGFRAVTYMPSRNTAKQLEKLRALCDRFAFFQISGEDINSPRQLFICPALRDKKFRNLIDATWALVGHELASTENPENGMFSENTVSKYPDLNARIHVFREFGMMHLNNSANKLL